MKPLILVAASLALLTSNLSAQQPPEGTKNLPDTSSTAAVPVATKHKHHKHPDFPAQLNLSPEQKAQIAQIKASTADRKQQHKEIKAVLTPDQRAQLKQLRKAWKAQISQ